jgi:hypothetical protein
MAHHVGVGGAGSRTIKGYRNRWGCVALKVTLAYPRFPAFSSHSNVLENWRTTAIPPIKLLVRREQAMQGDFIIRLLEHVPVFNANQMHSLSLDVCAAQVQLW